MCKIDRSQNAKTVCTFGSVCLSLFLYLFLASRHKLMLSVFFPLPSECNVINIIIISSSLFLSPSVQNSCVPARVPVCLCVCVRKSLSWFMLLKIVFALNIRLNFQYLHEFNSTFCCVAFSSFVLLRRNLNTVHKIKCAIQMELQ